MYLRTVADLQIAYDFLLRFAPLQFSLQHFTAGFLNFANKLLLTHRIDVLFVWHLL